MSNLAPHPFFREIQKKIDKLNQISQDIGKIEKIFRGVSISAPTYSCHEAGFLRTISWLYILFYEAGRVNVEFLVEYLNPSGLDSQGKAIKHIRVIHSMRTSLQHNLDLNENRDKSLRELSELWFVDRLGVMSPHKSKEWEKCLTDLLNESCETMELLIKSLTYIQKDDFCDGIVSQWNEKCSRYHPPHEYDRIIAIVASDMGMDHINALKIRNRYYESWSKELEYLHGDYDFEYEVRKRVQLALLRDPIIPITTVDIMNSFNINPGPLVGRLVKTAKEIYIQEPCDGPELLNRLHEIFPSL